MGLDIYLYRYDAPVEDIQAREKAAEEFSEAAWKRAGAGADYDKMTEAQKDGARTAVEEYNAANGLGKYGEDVRKVKIKQDSAKYPEHMFKVGYLRSSYNEGGINRVSSASVGVTLDDVFMPSDRYDFAPDWEASRQRCADWIAKLKTAPTLRATTVSPVLSATPPIDDERAISITVYQRRGWERRPEAERASYMNRDGHFYEKPLSIIAAIPGTDVLGRPCVHLVYEDAENFGWYIQAAEITLEMIDFVLAQPDRERYVLHWSG